MQTFYTHALMHAHTLKKFFVIIQYTAVVFDLKFLKGNFSASNNLCHRFKKNKPMNKINKHNNSKTQKQPTILKQSH